MIPLAIHVTQKSRYSTRRTAKNEFGIEWLPDADAMFERWQELAYNITDAMVKTGLDGTACDHEVKVFNATVPNYLKAKRARLALGLNKHGADNKIYLNYGVSLAVHASADYLACSRAYDIYTEAVGNDMMLPGNNVRAKGMRWLWRQYWPFGRYGAQMGDTLEFARDRRDECIYRFGNIMAEHIDPTRQ